jgi:hypothetical protein
MMSKQELYVYSLNGDTFQDREEETELSSRGWETREEALVAGREHAQLVARLKEADPSPVWTGVKVGYVAAAFFPTPDWLLEIMEESAQAEVGDDAAGDWPDIDDDTAGKELQEFVELTLHPFLEQWIEKHDLQPKFWSATDVVKHSDDDGVLEKADPA